MTVGPGWDTSPATIPQHPADCETVADDLARLTAYLSELTAVRSEQLGLPVAARRVRAGDIAKAVKLLDFGRFGF